MTTKSAVLSTLLLVVVLISACAPSAAQTPFPVSTTILEPSATPFQPVTPTEMPVTQDSGVVSTPTLVPPPIATSRGPDLHATDPTTVSLASGQYHFVEFFRFTWSTCRMMAPMVHGLEAEYFGKIIFSYLDADDPLTFDLQRALGFYYQPEIYFLDPNGALIMKWVGYTSEEDFETVFRQYLPWSELPAKLWLQGVCFD